MSVCVWKVIILFLFVVAIMH